MNEKVGASHLIKEWTEPMKNGGMVHFQQFDVLSPRTFATMTPQTNDQDRYFAVTHYKKATVLYSHHQGENPDDETYFVSIQNGDSFIAMDVFSRFEDYFKSSPEEIAWRSALSAKHELRYGAIWKTKPE